MLSIITILNTLIEKHTVDIENWFQSKFLNYQPVVNSSVDIRNSHYKIAPVDTNIFPAGYNNLNNHSQEFTVSTLKQYLDLYYPKYEKVLIIAEKHNRNIKYIDNILSLSNMLTSIGSNVLIGNHEITETIITTSNEGKRVEIFNIIQKDGLITTENGFIADLIIINNDFTKEAPKILLNNHSQPLIPSPYLGWFNRSKSQHFTIYNKLSLEFSRVFNIDHWLISSLISDCDNINFIKKDGIDFIAEKVEILIERIQQKFQEYEIKEQPYVFIKANNGTYGMGIMVARSGDEVLKINKKIKNKMNKIKDGQIINSVFIQEGIPSSEVFQNMTAEALAYNIGNQAVCFLYRYHNTKDKFSNLNSLGCNFIDISNTAEKAKLSVWALISKLASLAAAVEMKGIMPTK